MACVDINLPACGDTNLIHCGNWLSNFWKDVVLDLILKIKRLKTQGGKYSREDEFKVRGIKDSWNPKNELKPV